MRVVSVSVIAGWVWVMDVRTSNGPVKCSLDGAGYKERMEMMDDRPDKTEKFINL